MKYFRLRYFKLRIIRQKQRFLKSKWWENYRHSLKLQRWSLIDVKFIEEQKNRLESLFKR